MCGSAVQVRFATIKVGRFINKAKSRKNILLESRTGRIEKWIIPSE